MGRRRKKSVADHAEGLNVTINIASDDSKKVPMYDNSGTQLNSDGLVADYMDDTSTSMQSPENEYPKKPFPEDDDEFDTKDSFADDPLAKEAPEDGDGEEDPMAMDDPLAKEAPEGGEGEEDPMAMDDVDADMDSEEDMDDISGDMEDEDDEIAELAANYTHKQLYEALQLQKEAKASLGGGGSSDFSEAEEMEPEFAEEGDDEDKPPFKKNKPKDEDEDEEATKEFACSSKKKDYEEDSEDEDDDISSLKERVQQLEEELMKQKRMAREKEVSDFCESLYSQGKLTEKIVNRKDLSKFLVTLNSKNSVNFSEGGKQSQYRFMKSLLKRLPGVVSFSEVAAPQTAPKQSNTKLKPEADGYSYDNQSLDTHKRALSYAESHGVDYVTALKTVLN